MTDKQPDALRLADALQAEFPGYEVSDVAAAELRRLHAENEKFKAANITLMERIDRRDARIAALEQAGRMALEALEVGLWDYGPGQDEHMRCDEVIAHLRQALGDDA